MTWDRAVYLANLYAKETGYRFRVWKDPKWGDWRVSGA